MKEYLFWFSKLNNLISDLFIFIIILVVFIHMLNDIRLNSRKSKIMIIGSILIFITLSAGITVLKNKFEIMYHKVNLNEYNHYDYQLNLPEYINLVNSKVIMKEKLNVEFSTIKSSGFIEVRKNKNYIKHSISLKINEEVLHIEIKINPKESQQFERYFFDQGLECESYYRDYSYNCKTEVFEGKYIIVVDNLTVTDSDELQLFINSTSKLGFEIYNDYSVNLRGKY